MTDPIDHFSATWEHLSKASSIITIITFVAGILTLSLWWFNGIPGEVDMVRKEANETKDELEQFQACWRNLETDDPDCVADVQAMNKKMEEIIGLLEGVLPSGDSRSRGDVIIKKIRELLQELRKKIRELVRELKIRLSNDPSAAATRQDAQKQDAQTQDVPKQDASKQDAAATEPRSRWTWFWYSNELQARVTHARNLKYQLMFSYLHLLVKTYIFENGKPFDAAPRRIADMSELGLTNLLGEDTTVADGSSNDKSSDLAISDSPKAQSTRVDDSSDDTTVTPVSRADEVAPATAV